ncbi:YgjV family protein [Variovorax sp. PBL-E5]|uniref:YgjV family protein n=1 Tax=Variovorax sp. PBL-E5 TaxID=434014 RepID=UPI001317D060|nr:YgjV family protein [Variovorax sp. PBL-E5]VTU45462.1 Inner membrane protein YgjV [Variovorax sp. PBL-E5]
MDASHLIDATGIVALSLNVRGLVGASDKSLRRSTGIASAIWAVNNFLLGAHTAAALSMVSVGRQASAEAVQDRTSRTRLLAFAAVIAITLTASILTWNGWATLCTGAGSLVGTWAMFYLRGMHLRLAMVLVASLWMYNAWAYNSWWQMIANLASGGAASYGAWRARQMSIQAPA